MISYLRGKLMAKTAGAFVVEVAGVGYEVNLPGYVESQLRARPVGAEVELHILYHHPEQASRPKLFGFCTQLEREFFEELTRVKDLGPTRALSIFSGPVGRMARAIADGDTEALMRIRGVGPQMAKKIVAELQQRAAKYALLPEADAPASPSPTVEDAKAEVLAVLTAQLGHSRSEAQVLVEGALKRNPSIATSEELFNEVYKGSRR